MTMNVAQLAKQLNCSLPLAYELTRQEGFPAIRIGEKRIIIPVAAFERWLENSVSKGN